MTHELTIEMSYNDTKGFKPDSVINARLRFQVQTDFMKLNLL